MSMNIVGEVRRLATGKYHAQISAVSVHKTTTAEADGFDPGDAVARAARLALQEREELRER